jgi:hypothetical protein
MFCGFEKDVMHIGQTSHAAQVLVSAYPGYLLMQI